MRLLPQLVVPYLFQISRVDTFETLVKNEFGHLSAGNQIEALSRATPPRSRDDLRTRHYGSLIRNNARCCL